MAKNIERMKLIYDTRVRDLVYAYDKFKNQEPENLEDTVFVLGRKLSLGLDYMDNVEVFFNLMGLSEKFLKFAEIHDLLVRDTLSEDEYMYTEYEPKPHCPSDYVGQPVNHDRGWIIKEKISRHVSDYRFFDRIRNFEKDVSDFITYSDSVFEDYNDFFKDFDNERVDFLTMVMEIQKM